MHRLTVLYPPPADPDHFREYYVNTHLPLVAKMPGLIQSQYSLDVAGSKYFAVFHADFESAEALAAAQASEAGKAVSADVPNYATGGVEVMHYNLS